MLNGNEILRDWKNVSGLIPMLTDNEIHTIMECSNYPNDETYPRQQWVNWLRKTISTCTPVFWESNIRFAATSKKEIFIGADVPAVSPPKQYWFSHWDQAPKFKILEEPGEWRAHSEIISQEEDGSIIYVSILILMDVDFKHPASLERNIRMNVSVLDARGKIDDHPMHLDIISRIAFLSQPFIYVTSLNHVVNFTGAHHQIKRNEANKIQIVYLRRREQHPTLRDGSSNPVDWSCQWLVQGHWRNQYHPSDQSHKPMFIQSYVKGPEDKPFKTPRERIFAAVR